MNSGEATWKNKVIFKAMRLVWAQASGDHPCSASSMGCSGHHPRARTLPHERGWSQRAAPAHAGLGKRALAAHLCTKGSSDQITLKWRNANGTGAANQSNLQPWSSTVCLCHLINQPATLKQVCYSSSLLHINEIAEVQIKREGLIFGSFLPHHTTGDPNTGVASPQKQIWTWKAGCVTTLITTVKKKTGKKTPCFCTIPGY